MASTGKKWLIGCGVGCGMMILIIALIGGGIFFAVKDVIKEAESIGDTNDTMIEFFGQPQDFVPSADGSIAPDRMEAFLATRDATGESREKLARIIHMLDDKDGVEVDASPLDKIKAGVTLVPTVLTFIGERNKVLLENGMGDGEYTYIYALSYFNYLGKDVTDGPSFQMTGNDGGDSNFRWNVETSEDASNDLERREREIRTHLHRLQVSFLVNQMGQVGSAENLEAEREAMNLAPRRLLWEEGLPEVIASSIAPYADRLEDSYTPILNVVEVGMAQQGH